MLPLSLSCSLAGLAYAVARSKRWRFLPYAVRPQGSYSWEAKTAVLDPLPVKAGSTRRIRSGGGATWPRMSATWTLNRRGLPAVVPCGLTSWSPVWLHASQQRRSCRLQFPAASPAGPLCGCVSPSSAADCYLSGCTASPEAALLPRTMLGVVGGGRWSRSVAEAQGSDVVSSSLRALHKSLERTINESKKDCVRPVKMIQKTWPSAR